MQPAGKRKEHGKGRVCWRLGDGRRNGWGRGCVVLGDACWGTRARVVLWRCCGAVAAAWVSALLNSLRSHAKHVTWDPRVVGRGAARSALWLSRVQATAQLGMRGFPVASSRGGCCSRGHLESEATDTRPDMVFAIKMPYPAFPCWEFPNVACFDTTLFSDNG